MRRRGRLWCFVGLLALAGPVAPVHAADGDWPGLGRIWAWLEAWLPSVAVTGDQCSHIDPDGRCREGLAAAAGDQCSSIDPDGRCREGLAAAAGNQCSSIDPNGRCREGLAAAAGDQCAGIDPDG